MNNYGFQNELDFVNLFNNKYLNELDEKSIQFLEELFDGYLDNNELIRSWKNKSNEKADIFVKYKNCVKSISLKCGNSNSMHCESIQDFKKYLEKLGLPYRIIDKYISYHYGYKRNKYGNIDFSKVLSSYEYKEIYQDEIDIFNKSIDKTRIIIDMVDRFIIRGKFAEYDVDALISGRVNDYVWILKHDLYDLILSKRNIVYTSPHISCLTIGPKRRNLDGSSKNVRDKYLVCVRWHNIRDAIVEYKKYKKTS